MRWRWLGLSLGAAIVAAATLLPRDAFA